jgi:hypothetical protein
VAWVLGVYEFHMSIRKYSLNKNDEEVLNEEEIELCKELDDVVVRNFRVKRFIDENNVSD